MAKRRGRPSLHSCGNRSRRARIDLRGFDLFPLLASNINGLPVFAVTAEAPVVTPEAVRAALDDEP